MIIKNLDALDLSYIPKELPGRNNEIKTLYIKLRSLLYDKAITPILLLGPPGSGKTVTCKYTLQKFLDNVLTLNKMNIISSFISCKNTPMKTAIELCYDLGISNVPRRGLSFDEILDGFIFKFLDENRYQLILILDEFDRLFSNRRIRQDSEMFIYHLLEKKISLIGISNFLFIDKKIKDDRLKSRLFGSKLVFSRYHDFNIIKDIIKQRLDLSVEYESDVVSFLTAHTLKNLGDIRYLILLIKESALLADYDSKKLSIKHVKQAIPLVKQSLIQHIISKFPMDVKILLMCILESVPCTREMAYQKYVHYCNKMDTYCAGKDRVFDFIRDLISYGFIENVKKGLGKGYGWVNKLVYSYEGCERDIFIKVIKKSIYG